MFDFLIFLISLYYFLVVNHKFRFFHFSIKNFLSYALNLTTKLYHKKSIFGAVLLLIILIQCISGIMLSFYYISEPMIVPFLKNEEDMMDLYNDDFLYIHERLVDYIFIVMYLHMYRKLSYNVYNKNQINSWVSGSTLWLLMHFSIFFGLCLSCTHLSDVTLTIAANIMHTFTLKTGKTYWWLFTNKTLNSDTVIRIAYAHYIISLFILFISLFHSVEMHYDWKNSILDDGCDIAVFWIYFASKEELSFTIFTFFFISLFAKCLYELNEPLSYELFMWGDVGLINDVRFLGVAPHWYFRAYMGWLIVCPHHYIGIMGLFMYVALIYFQVYIKKIISYYLSLINFYKSIENTATYMIIFILFICSVLYTSSVLPYGKFFNRVEGNVILLFSYFIILIFLTKAYALIIYLFYWNAQTEPVTEWTFWRRKINLTWMRNFRLINGHPYKKDVYRQYLPGYYSKLKQFHHEYNLAPDSVVREVWIDLMDLKYKLRLHW